MRNAWIRAAAVALAASGPWTSPSSAGDDFPEIQARGALRVVANKDGMAEMFTLQPGAPPGLERELIESFASLHRLGVEFVMVPTVSERIPALLEGKGDVLVGAVAVTEERRKLVDFTVELLPLRHLVVTRRPHRVVETLDQLRQERVGTFKASSWAEQVAAAGVPPANVDQSFLSADEVVQGLRTGKVSAVVMAVSWALLEQRRDPDLQLGLFVGPSSGQAWAVRKDQPLLRRALDEYLTNVRRTPTWNRLAVKYFGDRAVETLRRSRGEP